MAARLNPRHQDMVRAKIKASCVIKMLMEHLEGKRELSQAQVASAKILLDKSVSNAPTTIQGPGDEGEHKLEVTWRDE